MPLNQLAKKGVTVLARSTDPNFPRETGLMLQREGREEYVWKTGDPLGFLLVSTGPVIKVNGKLQPLNSYRTTNVPDTSGMKVWITPLSIPGKEPQPSEVIADKGNTEYVIGKGKQKHQQ